LKVEEFDRAKATALFKSGLGKAEGELIASIVTPIYWYHQTAGGLAVRNGSIFFLDCGEGCFGVTAAHVVEGYRQDAAAHPSLICQIGHDLIINVEDRLIDIDPQIDIATVRISTDEVARLGKIVYAGAGKAWPPKPPTKDRGIIFAGFPGRERLFPTPRAIVFGVFSLGGIASSVSERDVCYQIERSELIDILGKGIMPEDYDMGGVSGGPMLTIVEQNGLRLTRLAGVVYCGPDVGSLHKIDGFDLVRARRADFLLPDGSLDRARWL
jgi:hypothetical protein